MHEILDEIHSGKMVMQHIKETTPFVKRILMPYPFDLPLYHK